MEFLVLRKLHTYAIDSYVFGLELSKRILDIFPPMMQRIRAEARVALRNKITLPQYRILANILQGTNTVSGIAENHGVAQPTMSKMVEGLVKRGMIKRMPDLRDRRQITLILTKKGILVYEEGRKLIQLRLSQQLSELNLNERESLAKTFDQLQTLMFKKAGGMKISHPVKRIKSAS